MSAGRPVFPPDFLDELRSRVSLGELVGRRVRLTRSGREQGGLCPFHNEKTPSFYVAEDKGFFHCFGCGAHGDAIGFVMRSENLGFREAVERLAADVGQTVEPARPDPDAAAAERRRADDARRIALARRIWDAASDARGSPVVRYLAGRAITMPPPPSLRWAPRCWHKEARANLPAMVALVEHVERGIVGLHRTYLLRDDAGIWRRRDRVLHGRKSLGPIDGGAVRLAPAAETMAVGEGIETAFAVMESTGLPVWAALSTTGLVKLVLPPLPAAGIVIIAADRDRNGAGEAAARAAARRWLAERRRVRIALPPVPGSDWADVLLGRDREAGHAS